MANENNVNGERQPQREDGVRTAEDKVQKLTDKYVKTVGDLVAAKEKEIMTV